MYNKHDKAMQNSIFKAFSNKAKPTNYSKKNDAIHSTVSAQGYYLSNPKFDMQQVLMLIGRNPKFNGMLIEGKPEDFEGLDENGNDRSRMAYYYVDQPVDVAITGDDNKIASVEKDICHNKEKAT